MAAKTRGDRLLLEIVNLSKHENDVKKSMENDNRIRYEWVNVDTGG